MRKASIRNGSILVGLFAGLAVLVTAPGWARGQPGGAPEAPWFGVPLPPVFEPHAAPVAIGDRSARPARVPEGEEHVPELDGASIRADLETVVAFSKASRVEREVGGGQLWGRISGWPSGERTVEWATEQFRAAGIEMVELQRFEQDPDASFWLPLSWEVTLLGDDRFGPGSGDVTLATAMPLAPSELPRPLVAPLIFVGTGRTAEQVHLDVAGKIAVQHITPQAHTVFERRTTVARARQLFERGAVAVVNVLGQPGHARTRDFSACGGPCFNLGGRDGRFLEEILDRAAAAGLAGAPRLRLRLATETYAGLSATNGVAVVRGRSRPDEHIVVNAHADAWFDGAGDNGDGLAVLIALARHFAAPARRPARSLVFVASAGHHSPGLHGPRAFVAANPEIAGGTLLVINIEHVAQRGLSPARRLGPDGHREFVADSGEAPIVAGITGAAPLLERLVREGIQRYGTNFVSDPVDMASGEGGGYRSLGVPIFTAMQASPLYHTSGEVLDVVSTPGLERMARFLAFLVKQVDGAPVEHLAP